MSTLLAFRIQTEAFNIYFFISLLNAQTENTLSLFVFLSACLCCCHNLKLLSQTKNLLVVSDYAMTMAYIVQHVQSNKI